MSPRDQRSERSLGGGGGGKYPRDRDRQRERERERDAYYKYNRGSNRDSRDGRNRDRSPKDRKSWQDHRGGRHQVQDRGGGGVRLDERGQDRGLERDRDRLDSRDSGHQSSGSAGSSATLRSVGDWSEHTSSSGKKYYYNCVSEVSQWEKPRDWLEFERQRSNAMFNNKMPPMLDRRSSSQKQVPMNVRDRSMRGGGNDMEYEDIDSRGSGGGRSGGRMDTIDRTGGTYGDPRGNLIRDSQQDMDISSSHDTTPTSDESHPQQQRQQQQQQQQQQVHHRGPESHHQRDLDYYIDNSQDKTPPLQQQQHSHHQQHQQQDNGTPSPVGGPPTPNTENSVNNLVSNSAVSNLVSSSPLVALKPQIPELTKSLARFYKESLIGHVTNWPPEAVEKTCQRINEEHLIISNLGITKVSTELKMARSLVRLAEIQATLQEQRILFLRQQSIDLESMRPRLPYVHSLNSEPHTNTFNAQLSHPSHSDSTSQQASPANSTQNQISTTPHAVVTSNA